jgi:aspartate aminotransferase
MKLDTRVAAAQTEIVDVAQFFTEPAPDLSSYAESMQGSTILKIAGEVREMLERGEKIVNLTVGDFRPDQFPVPSALTERIVEAHRQGETNYPPVPGVTELRETVREYVREDLGLDYPLEGILIAGGARPHLYTGYMTLVDPGDKAIYPVPSWNNHHYVRLSGALGVPIPVTPEKNFHLDRTDLEPHLHDARLLALNSPLNPTGTCIARDALEGICEAIVEENERRRAKKSRPFYLLYDQVYNALTFGNAKHFTPVGLVPEIAPYVVMTDAVSKALSGTGLRVGWALAPPSIVRKMAALGGHYGTWAPRPEQVGTARFLRDRTALEAHRREIRRRIEARLDSLDRGFREMRRAGLPVEHIAPQGAIYLSVRFDLIGRTLAGRSVRSNEDIRSLLLHEAGFAVVPFQAFGLSGESGWMRLSIGAVSVDEIHAGLERVRRLLEATRAGT